MFKERTNNTKYCLRKISGFICILAGISIMASKILFYMITGDAIPFEGRGQFLVGTGAALLGSTSLDPILGNFSIPGRQKGEKNANH